MEFFYFLNSTGILTVSIFGLLANSLCILVALHRDMRSPVVVLIIGLAVADSASLLSLNIFRGVQVGYRVNVNRVQDQIMDGVIEFIGMCSTFFIVVITVERYLVISRPFFARQ